MLLIESSSLEIGSPGRVGRRERSYFSLSIDSRASRLLTQGSRDRSTEFTYPHGLDEDVREMRQQGAALGWQQQIGGHEDQGQVRLAGVENLGQLKAAAVGQAQIQDG